MTSREDFEAWAKGNGWRLTWWPHTNNMYVDPCENEAWATWRKQDAEIAKARTTADFWKAEHLAGNAVIEQQKAEIASLREAVLLVVDALATDSGESGVSASEVMLSSGWTERPEVQRAMEAVTK